MTRQRIIIDTDPGVDDAIALWLALASPELEVLGITVVAGNVALENTLANARRIVSLSGRDDVPVFAGAKNRSSARSAMASTPISARSAMNWCRRTSAGSRRSTRWILLSAPRVGRPKSRTR